MKTSPRIFGVLTFGLTACGTQAPSQVNDIIGNQDTPDWSEADCIQGGLPCDNVLEVVNNGTHIGVGVVIANNSDTVYTVAHVASAIKNCAIAGLDCNGFVARNRNFESRIVSFQGLNVKTEVGSFRLEKKAVKAKDLMLSESAPTTGDEILVLGFHPDGRLLQSKGIVHSTQYEIRVRPHFTHDADTSPGMSGSLVVSTRTTAVVGLHFRGTNAQSPLNAATPVTKLLEFASQSP